MKIYLNIQIWICDSTLFDTETLRHFTLKHQNRPNAEPRCPRSSRDVHSVANCALEPNLLFLVLWAICGLDHMRPFQEQFTLGIQTSNGEYDVYSCGFDVSSSSSTGPKKSKLCIGAEFAFFWFCGPFAGQITRGHFRNNSFWAYRHRMVSMMCIVAGLM